MSQLYPIRLFSSQEFLFSRGVSHDAHPEGGFFDHSLSYGESSCQLGDISLLASSKGKHHGYWRGLDRSKLSK